MSPNVRFGNSRCAYVTLAEALLDCKVNSSRAGFTVSLSRLSEVYCTRKKKTTTPILKLLQEAGFIWWFRFK